MTESPDVFWGLVASLYIGNVMLLVLNLPMVPLFAQILRIPVYILHPLILGVTVVGAYSVSGRLFDVMMLATIYFVSEPGAEPAAPLDETWTPYVKYSHFWNFAHSPQSIPDSTPIEPIRLTTPLLGGISNFTIATLLAPLNSQLNQVLQSLKSRNLRGAFWSL